MTVKEIYNELNKYDNRIYMKNIKLKEIVFEKKVAIHCPEEWMDSIVRELAYNNIRKWIGNCQLNKHSTWGLFKDKYCICLRNKNYAWSQEIDCFNTSNFKVIPFEQSIQIYLHDQPLNVGDMVIRKDGLRDYKFSKIEYCFNELRCVFINMKNKDVSLSMSVDDMNYMFIWQNPYELTDEWKVKPKQKRDFSKYIHWEDKPKRATHFAISKYGLAFWYAGEPCLWENCWSTSLHEAGYRPQLLNEDGIVEDWQDSLVDLRELEKKNEKD